MNNSTDCCISSEEASFGSELFLFIFVPFVFVWMLIIVAFAACKLAFNNKIEPYIAKYRYSSTDSSTESRAEQNTEVYSISPQSEPNGLCTQTVKTSKSYTKYEISFSEQDCSEHGYDDTEQETDNDASVVRRQSSSSLGSIGSKNANWSMFNFAQFDDRNENDPLGEDPKRSQRGRIVLPPLVVSKQMLNNKRKGMNKAYTEEISESEDDDDNWTVIGLKHSQSEPVIPQKELALVSTRTHDVTDAGMKRIKSEVLTSKEYFSHEKIAAKGNSSDKKKGIILSVKRRMSLRKKRPKQKHEKEDEVIVANIIHESKSEPVIFKSTSV